MVGEFLCALQSVIGLEPLCDMSLLDGITIHQSLCIDMFLKVNSLLIFKMDRKTIDGRLLLMHWKFHYVPTALYRTYVM